MTSLQSARKFEELLTSEVESSPYDYAMMFKAEGFFARRRAKARLTLLKGLDAKLRRILRADERVYFVTSGTTVTVLEHFTVGWVATYLNMRALVFTTERMLLIEIDGGKKKAGNLVSQIAYTSLSSVKATWTGVCQIKLTDKSQYNFQSVPKADRKFLAEFLTEIGHSAAGLPAAPTGKGVEQLCPHCFAFVPGFPLGCPACHGAFKSARTAALRSLLFPGLGDWYLGHRGFAVFEMLGAGYFWLVLVIAPLVATLDPATRPNPSDYWVTVAILILIAHSVNATMTRHFARKGHHPESRRSAP